MWSNISVGSFDLNTTKLCIQHFLVRERKQKIPWNYKKCSRVLRYLLKFVQKINKKSHWLSRTRVYQLWKIRQSQTANAQQIHLWLREIIIMWLWKKRNKKMTRKIWLCAITLQNCWYNDACNSKHGTFISHIPAYQLNASYSRSLLFNSTLRTRSIFWKWFFESVCTKY